MDPASGPDTVTISGVSISAYTAVGMLFAFQGVDSTNPLGAATPSAEYGFGGAPPSASVMTSVADATVVGFLGMNETPSVSHTSGFSEIGSVATPPKVLPPAELEEYAESEGAPTSGGTYTSSPSLSSTPGWEEVVVALEPTCGCAPHGPPATDGAPSAANCVGCALSGPWFTLPVSPTVPDDVLLLAVTALNGPNAPSTTNVVSSPLLPWALLPDGLAPNYGPGEVNLSLYYVVDPTAGPVAVTFTTATNSLKGEGGADSAAALLVAFQGADSANPLGGGTPAFGTSLPVSITTVAPDATVVGVTWLNQTGSFTPTTGFTQLGTVQASGNPPPYNPQVDEEYAPEATPGTVSLNPTTSPTVIFGELAIALLPSCGCEASGTPTFAAGPATATCGGSPPAACGAGVWFAPSLSLSTPTGSDLLLLEVVTHGVSGPIPTSSLVFSPSSLSWASLPDIGGPTTSLLTVFWAIDATAGPVTVTMNGGGSLSPNLAVAMLFVFQGVDTANPFGAATPVSGPTFSQSILTNVADATVLSFAGMNDSPTITPTSGFSQAGSVAHGVTLPFIVQAYAEYEAAPTPGTYTSAPTGAAGGGGMLLVALEPTCGCQPNGTPTLVVSPTTGPMNASCSSCSGTWFTFTMSAVGPNELLVLEVTAMYTFGAPPTTADIGGNSLSWNAIVNPCLLPGSTHDWWCAIFYAPDPYPGVPQTVTFGSVGGSPPVQSAGAMLFVFQGVDLSDPLGAGTPVFHPGAPPVSIVTLHRATVVGIVWTNYTAKFTPTSSPSPGFTEIGTASQAGFLYPDNGMTYAEYQQEATSGTYTSDPVITFFPNGDVYGTLAIALNPCGCNYTATFNETGLPDGATWDVTLNGVTISATVEGVGAGPTGLPAYPIGTSITFTGLCNNTLYAYNISAPPGFEASPSSGELEIPSTLAPGGEVYTNITLTSCVDTATFDEMSLPASGLDSGWAITLMPTSGGPSRVLSSHGTSLTFAGLCPGSYDWKVSSQPAADVANPSSGVVVVPFSGPNAHGEGYVGIVFSPAYCSYRVVFWESGLPVVRKPKWAVTFDGMTRSATVSSLGSSLTFTVRSCGTYSFTPSYPGYVVTYPTLPASITLVPYDKGFSSGVIYQVVFFAPPTGPTLTGCNYTATFDESGLAASALSAGWSVALNGTITVSHTTSLTVTKLCRGSYAWSVYTVVGGIVANPSTGVVVVPYSGPRAQGEGYVGIVFSKAYCDYKVIFWESGLPVKAKWTVTFDGMTRSATVSSLGSSITFTVKACGSYSFTASSKGVVVPYPILPSSLVLTPYDKGFSTGTVYQVIFFT